MTFRVIPVLDVRSSIAVRAVGGQRAYYRPLTSRLHPDSDPIPLARAVRQGLDCHELYLADLDAIAGGPPDVALYGGLHASGLALWVDAGVRDVSTLLPLLEAGVGTILVGLETVRGPAATAEVVAATGPGRVVFSLDLREGRPIVAEGAGWGTDDPMALAGAAIEGGVRRLLLLDLARVGMGRGVGTLSLLERLHEAHPDVEMAVGGGIAGSADLLPIARAGGSAALVGSALHDGRIGAGDVERAKRMGHLDVGF
jgi:phosphoribosylformimino-5-aminoimidazole carboxamide ribotide isomerase